MPDVRLTKPMQDYAQEQVEAGAYADLGEVVRAGLRLLMERDGARGFYTLRAELGEAVRDAEAGRLADFDPKAFEPDAFLA